MMKSLPLFLYRCILICSCCLALSNAARAQTDADALMMPKKFFCAGAIYSNSSWTNYWEGTFKRDNGNIGKLSTDMYMFMGVYGLTNKLNILVSAPYVTTHASAGTLAGQRGLQDITLSLKWMAFQSEVGKGILTFHAIASGSIPLSNYEADFQPMSIGLHSNTVAVRGLVNYQEGRFFIAGAGQYMLRNDVTIDRNAYYTDHLIYSNQVDMPNANNFLISSGYRSLKFNAEAIFMQSTTLGGFDIRKNDMPFPSNTMNATTAGALLKYSFSASGLELTGGGNYVLKGRNVGQATTFFGGVLYVFDFNKTKAK